MPETETIMVNGHPIIIEKVISSGDLLTSLLLTIAIAVLIAFSILFFFGGRK